MPSHSVVDVIWQHMPYITMSRIWLGSCPSHWVPKVFTGRAFTSRDKTSFKVNLTNEPSRKTLPAIRLSHILTSLTFLPLKQILPVTYQWVVVKLSRRQNFWRTLVTARYQYLLPTKPNPATSEVHDKTACTSFLLIWKICYQLTGTFDFPIKRSSRALVAQWCSFAN